MFINNRLGATAEKFNGAEDIPAVIAFVGQDVTVSADLKSIRFADQVVPVGSLIVKDSGGNFSVFLQGAN